MKEVIYFVVVKSKNHMQHHIAIIESDVELSKNHFFEWLMERQEESKKEFGEDVLIIDCKRI